MCFRCHVLIHGDHSSDDALLFLTDLEIEDIEIDHGRDQSCSQNHSFSRFERDGNVELVVDVRFILRC